MKKLTLLIILLIFCIMPTVAKPSFIDEFPTQEQIVGLTLEDINDNATLLGILEICQREKVRVTLFCPGQFIEKTPDKFIKLKKLGYEFGICGLKYAEWSELRTEEILREYQLTKKMLPQANYKIDLVRPPYDYYHNNVLTAFEEQTNVLVIRGMTIASGRTELPLIHKGSIINIKMNEEDALIVLHDTIQELKRRGYQIKTVSDVLNSKLCK